MSVPHESRRMTGNDVDIDLGRTGKKRSRFGQIFLTKKTPLSLAA